MLSLQFSKKFYFKTVRQRAIEEDIPHSVLASTYPQRTYVHAPHVLEGKKWEGKKWKGMRREEREGVGEIRGGKIYRNYANGYT